MKKSAASTARLHKSRQSEGKASGRRTGISMQSCSLGPQTPACGCRLRWAGICAVLQKEVRRRHLRFAFGRESASRRPGMRVQRVSVACHCLLLQRVAWGVSGQSHSAHTLPRETGQRPATLQLLVHGPTVWCVIAHRLHRPANPPEATVISRWARTSARRPGFRLEGLARWRIPVRNGAKDRDGGPRLHPVLHAMDRCL